MNVFTRQQYEEALKRDQEQKRNPPTRKSSSRSSNSSSGRSLGSKSTISNPGFMKRTIRRILPVTHRKRLRSKKRRHTRRVSVRNQKLRNQIEEEIIWVAKDPYMTDDQKAAKISKILDKK